MAEEYIITKEQKVIALSIADKILGSAPTEMPERQKAAFEDLVNVVEMMLESIGEDNMDSLSDGEKSAMGALAVSGLLMGDIKEL